MKSNKRINSMALMLAAWLVAGISFAGEPRPDAWVISGDGTFVSNGLAYTTAGAEQKLSVGIKGMSCSQFKSDDFRYPSNLQGVQTLGCEEVRDVASFGLTWTAAAANGNGEDLRFSYGPFSETFRMTIKEPAPDPAAFVPREEYDVHVDDYEEHKKSRHGGPADGRVDIDLLFGGLPNTDADVQPPLGVNIALGFKVLRHDYSSDGNIGLKLMAAYSHHWGVWWVNPAINPTDEETAIDIDTLSMRANFSWQPIHWFEMNPGLEFGARRYFYDSQIVRQGPNPADPTDSTAQYRVLVENNHEQWTPIVGPYLDVRFLPVSYLSIVLAGKGMYNTDDVQRTVFDLSLEGEKRFTWEGMIGVGVRL